MTLRVKQIQIPAPKLADVLVKDLHDNEVICETCGGLGLVIEPHRYGVKGEGRHSMTLHFYDPFPYKKEVLWPCPNCYSGVRQVCPHCGAAVKWLPQHICEGVRQEQREKKRVAEAEALEKAEKISVKEAEKRGIVYLWDDSDRLLTLDEAQYRIDDWYEDAEEGDPPIGHYAAKLTGRVGFDANNLVDNACDELHEAAHDNISHEQVKELQALLDEWASKITGTETYEPDYKVFVVLREAGATP